MTNNNDPFGTYEHLLAAKPDTQDLTERSSYGPRLEPEWKANATDVRRIVFDEELQLWLSEPVPDDDDYDDDEEDLYDEDEFDDGYPKPENIAVSVPMLPAPGDTPRTIVTDSVRANPELTHYRNTLGEVLPIPEPEDRERMNDSTESTNHDNDHLGRVIVHGQTDSHGYDNAARRTDDLWLTDDPRWMR